jgi:branched-chain amino acid transport system ATP-binding protein
LSHGDQRKLEVAMLIALDPMVYMFDEPTAGMSVDEAPVVLDLIAELKADSDRTILLVEHKMDVIRSSPIGSSCCTTARWPPTACRPR